MSLSPRRHAAGRVVAFAVILTLAAVAFAGLVDGSPSSRPLVRVETAVALIGGHTSPVVGAHRAVLAGDCRVRGPDYDPAAVGFCVAPETASGGSELGGDIGGDVTRVGRWMSPVEFDAMVESGTVQEGAGGVTSVANPADPEAYMRQAAPGSTYAEFDVPSESLSPGGKEGWASIRGPNSWFARYGRALPEMPSATSIEWIASKLWP